MQNMFVLRPLYLSFRSEKFYSHNLIRPQESRAFVSIAVDRRRKLSRRDEGASAASCNQRRPASVFWQYPVTSRPFRTKCKKNIINSCYVPQSGNKCLCASKLTVTMLHDGNR